MQVYFLQERKYTFALGAVESLGVHDLQQANKALRQQARKLKGVVPMPTDLQSRTQYLALAEFCQRIISSLSEYVNGTAEVPASDLQAVLKALQSVQSGDPYKFGQRAAAALVSYEQVRTLEEVWKLPQLDDAVKLTGDLLTNEVGDDNVAKAKKVIDLFSKLQAKALWNFEQPKQTAPPDVGELCRALETA
jgi:hypothetical protein